MGPRERGAVEAKKNEGKNLGRCCPELGTFKGDGALPVDVRSRLDSELAVRLRTRWKQHRAGGDGIIFLRSKGPRNCFMWDLRTLEPQKYSETYYHETLIHVCM